MRCEDVRRELVTPSGLGSPGLLADHLASCPACAEHSRSADRFQRVWEATRPPEPSAEALDALWARAAEEIGSKKSAVIPFRAPARRGRWAVVAFLGAQAATVLVAGSFLFRNDVRVAAEAPARVIANVDQTLIVRIDDDGHRVEILDDSEQFAFASMADATPHDVFNALESMATK